MPVPITLKRLGILLSAALLLAAGPARAAKDELVIGITQFPSTFHPIIDSMLAKSYILAMTRRAVTIYDANWELICLLCTELPTLDNGRAVIEDLGNGKTGIALTVTLHPDATWGDGTPVTSADMVFTWNVGRHPQSGVSSNEAYRRILSIDVVDDKTFTLHVDRVTFDYNSIGFELLPAHIERDRFAEPLEYKNRTAYDTDTANPGLYFGPYRIAESVPGAHVVKFPVGKPWRTVTRLTFQSLVNFFACQTRSLPVREG